ncbi:MAG TPA: DMT family transporter [Aestuariivirgaceae bacterium]|nr:DMT family transporter [Aestuariivirgaceae bacterium]
MSPTSRRIEGWILIVLSAVAWSTAGFFTRAVDADAWTLLFWRGVFAGLAIMAMTIAIYRGETVAVFRRLGLPGLLLALSSTAGMLCFISGLTLTTVANVYAIYATAPFVTAACALVILGERAPRTTLFASAVAMAGVLVTLDPSDLGGNLLGQLLAFGMTLSMALMTVILRWKRDLPMVPALGLSAWLATLVCWFFCEPFAIPAADIGILALFGIVNSAVGLSLYGWGSRLTPAAEVALISLIDVPLGPLWVWLFFDETPGARTLVGGLIVLAAVVFHILGEMRVASKPKFAAE